MTSLESGWSSGGGGPVFMNPPNYFGAAPAHSWSHNSGPYFGEAGSTGNGMLSTRPSRDAAFVPFFGIPTKEDIPDPYEAYDIENLQLPDGFKGNRPYLKYIILKQVTLAEQFPYREAAPFVRNDHSQEICWDIWMFNNHLLGRTPEESVSRMLTMNVTQSRESMVRYGIALMLEHGFMRTPKGRENYRRNMDQIAAATATTLAYGAMYALLNSKYSDPNNKYRRQHTRNLYEMQQLFREEIVNFGIVQKKLDGYKIVSEKCSERLKQQVGRGGNYTIVPPRVTKYRPPQSFITAADKLPLMWDKMLGDPANGGSPPMGTVKESVGYRVGEHQPNDDPCIRERTIGGFFQMLPTNIEDVPPEEFKTHMMDTKIYSEDKDDWHLLRYAYAVRQCGLFDEDWNLTENLGRPFFDSVGTTWGAYMTAAGVLDTVVGQVMALQGSALQELGVLFMTQTTTNDPLGGVGGAVLGPAAPVTSLASGSAGTTDLLSYFANPNRGKAADVRGHVPYVLVSGEDDIEAEAVDVTRSIDALSVSSARVKHDLVRFAKVLMAADAAPWSGKKPGKLAQRFAGLLAEITGSPDKQVEEKDLLLCAIAVMKVELLASDENRALHELSERSSRSGCELTSLERLLVSSRDGIDQARMREAAAKSPRWLPFGYGANNPPTHRLLVTVHGATAHELKLGSPSLALTLSSTAVVLFNVSVEEYNIHLKTIGTSFTELTLPTKPIALEIPHDAGMEDGLRLSMLQFSVTLSMLYRIFYEYTFKLEKAASASKAAQNELYAQLAKHAWALCPRVHPLWQDAEHYTDDVNAHAGSLPVLLCQTRFHRVIGELRALAKAVINDSAATTAPLALVKAVHVLFIQLLDHSENGVSSFHGVPVTKDVSGGEVDFGVSIVQANHAAGITEKLTEVSLKKNKSPSSFRKELAKDAEERTVRILAELKAKAAAGEEKDKLKEMFNIFGNSIMDTWIAMAIYRETVLEAERELVWKAFVNTLYDLSVTDKSVTPVQAITLSKCLVEDLVKDVVSSSAMAYTNAAFGNAVDAARLKFAKDRIEAYMKAFKRDPTAITKELQEFSGKVTMLRTTGMQSGAAGVGSGGNGVTSVFNSIHAKMVKAAVTDNKGKPLDATQMKKVIEGSLATALAYPEVVAAETGDTKKRLVDIFLKWPIIDGAFVAFCIKYHLWPLLGFLGFRPHKRYMMGTMIHMMGWGEAAKTYYGHADFQLGDNIAQKVHTGHFTMYAKTIVLRTDMVVRGDNVIVYNYEGGNGHRIWNPSDPDHVDAYRSNELDCDIFLAPVLPNYRCNTQFMDVSGRFSDRLSPNDDAQRATDYGPSARILSGIWGWRAIASPLNRDHFSNLAPKFSTLVFQERQILWDHSVRKLATYTHDHGHLGPDVGPGCKDWHTGADMYARPSGVAQRAPSGVSAY